MAASAPVMAAFRAASGAPALSDSDIQSLADALQGDLILKTMPGYQVASQLYNTRFDGIQPLAVAQCQSEADVVACMQWCIQHDIRFRARAGGHNYCGWSSCEGLVIDVGPMKSMSYESSTTHAVFGAGCQLVDVYHYLGTNHGRVVPGGTCPSVGLTGLLLGGGQGMISRKYGMTSDQLIEARVVYYDGNEVKVVPCNQSVNPDLYWALRGGGGGNFGIVTSMKVKTYEIDTISSAVITWTWADAQKVLEKWMTWGPDVTELMSMNLILTSKYQSDPRAILAVACLDTTSNMVGYLSDILDPSIGTPQYQNDTPKNEPWLTYSLGSCHNYDECHFESDDWPTGDLKRKAYKSHSDYYTQPITQDGFDVIDHWLQARTANPAMTGGASFHLDLNGSASEINKVASDATAFVHRDTICCAQYTTYWEPNAHCDVVEQNLEWSRGFYAAMQPFSSDQSYQNYCDDELVDWANRYYGANLHRLRKIKHEYDPDNLFTFPQSIPPITGGMP